MVFKTEEKSADNGGFLPTKISDSISVFFDVFRPFSGCFSRCSWPLRQLQTDLSRGSL
jgi:hypothetical protein